ncbi:hypothetical protein NM208_g10942 [Fusarium decemcellulare]|uniref:Uncharacterized protein n=1 Tax=Fusarium decemcellulare TaxID=57161 RepID=A0ACC1RW33_9HYPO|nr:hypothetical protein NM208_g10942 [Fusarium decemcellulare]
MDLASAGLVQEVPCITDDLKNPCFTHEVVNATDECFRPFGLEVIKVDLHKECRRNEHCLRIKPGRESFTLGLCTAIEILVAARVFGIKVQATIAWSKTVSNPGGPTDIILGWDASLFKPQRRVLAAFRPLPRDFKHSIQLAGMANYRPSQLVSGRQRDLLFQGELDTPQTEPDKGKNFTLVTEMESPFDDVSATVVETPHHPQATSPSRLRPQLPCITCTGSIVIILDAPSSPSLAQLLRRPTLLPVSPPVSSSAGFRGNPAQAVAHLLLCDRAKHEFLNFALKTSDKIAHHGRRHDTPRLPLRNPRLLCK